MSEPKRMGEIGMSKLYTGCIVEESLTDNRILNTLTIAKVRIGSSESPASRWHLYTVKKCFGHYPSYALAGTYTTLAVKAAEFGIAFEHNTGLHHRLNLPRLGLEPQFLETLVAHRVEIITASDAHRPEDVGLHIAEAQAQVRGARR